jgi:hypothetical protein
MIVHELVDGAAEGSATMRRISVSLVPPVKPGPTVPDIHFSQTGV